MPDLTPRRAIATAVILIAVAGCTPPAGATPSPSRTAPPPTAAFHVEGDELVATHLDDGTPPS